MIAYVRLQLDGTGVVPDSLRNTGKGGKLKRYVSLHRGEGVKMIKISVT